MSRIPTTSYDFVRPTKEMPHIQKVALGLSDDRKTGFLALVVRSKHGVLVTHEYAFRLAMAGSLGRLLQDLADGRLPAAD